MKDFELKLCRAESVDFINKIVPNTKIELKNKYSYNVGYSKNNTCTGEFKAEVFDKNDVENFHLTVVMKAVFITAQGVPKEQLHIKTYDAVFPYVKAFVTNLTASAGIPPIYLPYIDISNQNIYRVEMPNGLKGKSEDKE